MSIFLIAGLFMVGIAQLWTWEWVTNPGPRVSEPGWTMMMITFAVLSFPLTIPTFVVAMLVAGLRHRD